MAIYPEAVAAIQQYLDKAGHGADKNNFLFRPVKNGRAKASLTRQQFYNLFKSYAKLSGVPEEVTPHSARATFITKAYKAGWLGEAIQRTVAHASITTTEGYNKAEKKLKDSASFAMKF